MKAEITPCDGSGSKTWLDRRKMARFARCSATFAYKIGHIENCCSHKHNLVQAPIAWAHSSLGRYVQAGLYPADWGAEGPVTFPDNVGHE